MSSTLTPENLPAGPDRRINKGHGTAALGPSDNSDSGSDLVGAPGLAQDAGPFGSKVRRGRPRILDLEPDPRRVSRR